MASGSIFLRKSLIQAEIFLTFFLTFTVYPFRIIKLRLILSNFNVYYNDIAMELINDASRILIWVFFEKLSIVVIEAENFEAGDFLTIFLSFGGF